MAGKLDLISICPCYKAAKRPITSRLKDRWRALVHIINAKYLDTTNSNKEKLATHELILSQVMLIYEDEDVIEDLHMVYMINHSLIEQYLPQICSYISFSISDFSRRLLNEFLLAKCKQSTSFAHAVYWQFMNQINPRLRSSSRIIAIANKVSTASSAAFKHLSSEDTGGTGNLESRNFFKTIDFVQKLVDASQKLISVPKDMRKIALDKMLLEIDEEFLPSKFISLPFKGQERRYLYKIYREYSFPLSTKERVPFQITIGTIENEANWRFNCNEDHEIIEQKLINRSLNRLNLTEIDPDLLEDSGVDEEEVSLIDNKSATQPKTCISCFKNSKEKQKSLFYLRKKPRGLFGETSLKEIEEHVQQSEPEVKLISLIIKANDDIRQEQFASQLVFMFKTIFSQSKLKLWVRDFLVIPVSQNGGIIETIDNAISIDRLKKFDDSFVSLRTYFIDTFGPENSDRFAKATKNFIESLAGYSLFCYLFQVKDRNNGNILIDSEGHIIDIDFGYMLSRTPGSVNFESAPFKLTAEYLEVMGGQSSWLFLEFKKLIIQGFLALREHRYKIVRFVEICMQTSKLQCFEDGEALIEALNARFAPEMSKHQCKHLMLSLIERACDNWRTRWYDIYQQICVGIW
ncbi:unnamed protein product [Blepharisma stoltei]|uniref:1-phosphatidylinositol 4-kinase n=1 Tax=Blepharisma stoltei TaxID=1481888 RepID=A0AAU9J6U1_9CILI|nr:unnamed protein product [Blepharisma stoltei]